MVIIIFLSFIFWDFFFLIITIIIIILFKLVWCIASSLGLHLMSFGSLAFSLSKYYLMHKGCDTLASWKPKKEVVGASRWSYLAWDVVRNLTQDMVIDMLTRHIIKAKQFTALMGRMICNCQTKISSITKNKLLSVIHVSWAEVNNATIATEDESRSKECNF